MLFDKSVGAFKKVDVSNFGILRDYFMNADLDWKSVGSDAYPVCAFTYLKTSYAIIDGYLFTITDRNELLHIPFNEKCEFMPLDILVGCMKDNGIKKIICIPESAVFVNGEVGKATRKLFHVREQKYLGYEYVYDNFEMAKMEGKSFKNFRSNVHKYENKYGDKTVIVPYNESMYGDAIKTYEHWLSTNATKIIGRGEQVWDKEFYVFCLNHYKELDLDFYLVYYDDECIGAFCYNLVNEDMAYCVFRKLSEEYQNLVQYAQYYQAKILTDMEIHYYNDAYDGGSVGLAEMKTRFKPVNKVKLFELTFNNGKKGGNK